MKCQKVRLFLNVSLSVLQPFIFCCLTLFQQFQCPFTQSLSSKRPSKPNFYRNEKMGDPFCHKISTDTQHDCLLLGCQWSVSAWCGCTGGHTTCFNMACTRTCYHPGFGKYQQKELLINYCYLCGHYFRVFYQDTENTTDLTQLGETY